MSSINIAVLWDSVSWDGERPSSYDEINDSYEEFSRLAAERDARVLMANYEWFSDGSLEKCFRFDGGDWIREEDVDVDIVFDKFDFSEDVKGLKKGIAEEVPVVNDWRLEEIAADKLESYRLFPDLLPEVREATDENVLEMLDAYGRVVVKPRSDYGGEGVEVIDSFEEFEPGDDLLVQRFVDSSEGVPSLDVDGVHDLRVLVVSGDAVAVQIRQPDSGLISNVHRGGETFFVEMDDVPEDVFDRVEEVAEEFSDFRPSLYSVDFIFDSEGNPWVLEFNSKPGLLFYGDEELKRHKVKVMERLLDALVKAAGN